MKLAAFLGTGNMGGALVRAACRSVGPDEVIIANRSFEKARNLAAETGCTAVEDVRSAVREAQYIFLGVKPNMVEDLLSEIRGELAKGQVLVSMAAGVTLETLQHMAPRQITVLRIMPNMPCSIGRGMTALCAPAETDESHLAAVEKILRESGRVCRIDEDKMDAFSAVAGCGPAFAFQFIEALADGGVLAGLPRASAITYAAQMLLGSAAMVLESGKHPGVLKDEVCSPGGSTIEGVAVLERRGFRGAVTDSVEAAWRKNTALGKK